MYLGTIIFAKATMILEQFQHLLLGISLYALGFTQSGEFRLLVGYCITYLSHRTETSYLDIYILAACRVYAKHLLAAERAQVVGCGCYSMIKVLIKVTYHIVPLSFTFCNLVKLLLCVGGEVIIYDSLEIL